MVITLELWPTKGHNRTGAGRFSLPNSLTGNGI